MSEEIVRELANKAYTRRKEYDEGKQNDKESLEELSTFVQQLMEAGKKVVLSIEFGIRRFERNRFRQITEHLAKDYFSTYDKDTVYVILGVDGDFTNESMLETLNELRESPLSEPYNLINIREPSDFQVRPLPGNEAEVQEGTCNVYSFEIEKRGQMNIQNVPPKYNTRKRTQESKKMKVYTYFMKKTIKSSYFTNCKHYVLYHKAQQSASIRDFSRNSIPDLPFWKGIETLCGHPYKKIVYTNIAHLDTNGMDYIPSIQKVINMRQLRLNKFSEQFSEIWYILLNVHTNGTPVLLLDLDLQSNRTYEIEEGGVFVPLSTALKFKKQDESTRIGIAAGTYDSIMAFMEINPPSYQWPRLAVSAFDWDSLCPDAPEVVNGGGKRKTKKYKYKKRASKTKKHGKKQ